jgi:hypothetical protein
VKTIFLILLLALSSTGCSSFSKNARADRAYRKYIKQSVVARQTRQKQILQHQRAEAPSLRNSAPPLEMQTAQQTPESVTASDSQ